MWLLDPRKKDERAQRKPGTKDPRRWRARFIDASGKRRTITLEPRDAKTPKARLEWAIKRSESLQLERSQVKAGLLYAAENVSLTEARERFFNAHPRLSEGTKRSYRTAFATLISGRERLGTLDLTPKLLELWHTERVNVGRSVARKAGAMGEKTKSKRLRSAASVNKELRSVGAWLYWLHENHYLRLTRDDLRAALKKEDFKPKRKPFLRLEAIAELMTACAKHDAEARHAKTGNQRHQVITPLVRFLLLTGMRVGEALALVWGDVHDDQIVVRAEISKTREERPVPMEVSPTALQGLMRGHADELVFGLTDAHARAAIKRLAACGAPEFTWHTLRRTCGTFLTCAPNIYKAASAYLSAQRLGHSVQIAEKHYVGMVRVSADAKTLEQAMQI